MSYRTNACSCWLYGVDPSSSLTLKGFRAEERAPKSWLVVDFERSSCTSNKNPNLAIMIKNIIKDIKRLGKSLKRFSCSCECAANVITLRKDTTSTALGTAPKPAVHVALSIQPALEHRVKAQGPAQRSARIPSHAAAARPANRRLPLQA